MDPGEVAPSLALRGPFDRRLAASRRARMRAGADFLLHRVAEDFVDRLGMVSRDFACAVDLGTPGDALRARLAKRVPFIAALRGPGLEGVADVIVDEEALPLREGHVDLILSALALHAVNDLPGALVQIRRALRPDGLFMAAFCGGDTLTELRESLAVAEAEILGGVSPHVGPFVELRDAGGLLQRAGFALPVVDLDRLVVRYATPLSLMHDLRAMGATSVLRERSRRPMRRAVLARAMEVYAERHADADGRLRATFDILWLSGWAPHESQQQPLRPGSAKVNLADVLGRSSSSGQSSETSD